MALRMLLKRAASGAAPRVCGPARFGGGQMRWCSTKGRQQQEGAEPQPEAPPSGNDPKSAGQAPKERPEGEADREVQGEEATYSSDEDLSLEIEKLEEDVEKYKALFLRAEADQEQIKTVAQKDVLNARRFGCQDLAKALLRPLDNFDRVLNEFDSDAASTDKNLVDGLRMVQSGFLQSLSSSGISKIDVKPLETEFDPNFHEAVKMIPPAEGVGSSVVAEELASGYRYNERVLRATVVVVTE